MMTMVVKDIPIQQHITIIRRQTSVKLQSATTRTHSSALPSYGTSTPPRARGARARASLMTCNPNLEIGWREPADLVPRHLGNKCEPWWVRDAVYLLDRIIKPNWRVLEWGAGSSTVWFAQHAGSVTTIEDSGEWVRDLGFILKNHSITNVELRHRARQTNGTMPSASRGCCYDDYIRGAVDLPNASFDLVSVDGRARERCLEEAVRLVNPIGGVLVLDNSVRDRYQKPMEDFIPQTWLRHDAHLLKNVTVQQKKWVDRDDLFTTFWITRR